MRHSETLGTRQRKEEASKDPQHRILLGREDANAVSKFARSSSVTVTFHYVLCNRRTSPMAPPQPILSCVCVTVAGSNTRAVSRTDVRDKLTLPAIHPSIRRRPLAPWLHSPTRDSNWAAQLSIFRLFAFLHIFFFRASLLFGGRRALGRCEQGPAEVGTQAQKAVSAGRSAECSALVGARCCASFLAPRGRKCCCCCCPPSRLAPIPSCEAADC